MKFSHQLHVDVYSWSRISCLKHCDEICNDDYSLNFFNNINRNSNISDHRINVKRLIETFFRSLNLLIEHVFCFFFNNLIVVVLVIFLMTTATGILIEKNENWSFLTRLNSYNISTLRHVFFVSKWCFSSFLIWRQSFTFNQTYSFFLINFQIINVLKQIWWQTKSLIFAYFCYAAMQIERHNLQNTMKSFQILKNAFLLMTNETDLDKRFVTMIICRALWDFCQILKNALSLMINEMKQLSFVLNKSIVEDSSMCENNTIN